MQAESKQGHTWVRIGASYGAVVGDKIAALVYHGDAQPGEIGGPGGDPTVTDAGWFLVWTHDPHHHFQLATPAATAGMLEQVAYAALSEAGEIIDDQLARGNH